MTQLQALLESEDTQKYFESHNELISEGVDAVNDFRKVMKAFVLNNAESFIAENIDQTRKNILAFSETATNQFMIETSAIIGSMSSEQEVVSEQSINDYF